MKQKKPKEPKKPKKPGKPDWNILTPQERLSLELRQVYEAAGFRLYRMGRFEEYALYQENRRFLESGQVLTFTDLDGRLMALKPDVTLSIAKNAAVEPGTAGRFYYLENVCRPDRAGRTFREIRQMGVECIGVPPESGRDRAREASDRAAVAELAVRSLTAAGAGAVLELGHMGFVTGLLDTMGVPSERHGQTIRFIGDRRYQEALSFAARGVQLRAAELLLALEEMSGDWREVLPDAADLCRDMRESGLPRTEAMEAALSDLRAVCEALAGVGLDGGVRVNLSLTGEQRYYNGLLLRGYLPGLPRPVLKGGQYDYLAARFHAGGAYAVGFALYLDELEQPAAPPDALLSVALPKGRLGDKVLNLLSAAGYGVTEDYGRKLVVENPAAGIRYFLVKPSDVPVYVEHGAADVGLAGKDILEESGADVYELLDTGLGKCRMCVAAPEGFQDAPGRPLRVATKFVNIAKRHYAAKGREIDVIKLNGSIELAPLLGLSDVIVDIVETGTTLRENGLRVLEEFLPVSARLIANRSAYGFRREEIDALAEKLREVAEA